MQFSKWHALGNAYLVVARGAGRPLDAPTAQRLCDPEHGVGSDGVVEIVERSTGAATIVIWNPDGSVAELSGNGVRIAARALLAQTGGDVIEITSTGRTMACRLLAGDLVETAMGEVVIEPSERLAVGDDTFDVIPATVGNPHAVIRLASCDRDDLLRIGPAVERHPRFPARTNVQLVEPVGPQTIRCLVWERGAGETSSSGSSATAVAAVAVARGWCTSPVTVRMPGGDLTVAVADGTALLVGPAEKLYEGEISLD